MPHETRMPIDLTPKSLDAALRAHGGRVLETCRALGVPKQRLYQRADLRAVLAEHAKLRPPPQRSVHGLSVPADVAAALERAAGKPNRRSLTARRWLAAELAHGLPAPEPPSGSGVMLCLSLAGLWHDVQTAAGTEDATADLVRALLRRAAERLQKYGV